eukprot:468983-Amphidinium_carterae.1
MAAGNCYEGCEDREPQTFACSNTSPCASLGSDSVRSKCAPYNWIHRHALSMKQTWWLGCQLWPAQNRPHVMKATFPSSIRVLDIGCVKLMPKHFVS